MYTLYQITLIILIVLLLYKIIINEFCIKTNLPNGMDDFICRHPILIFKSFYKIMNRVGLRYIKAVKNNMKIILTFTNIALSHKVEDNVENLFNSYFYIVFLKKKIVYKLTISTKEKDDLENLNLKNINIICTNIISGNNFYLLSDNVFHLAANNKYNSSDMINEETYNELINFFNIIKHSFNFINCIKNTYYRNKKDIMIANYWANEPDKEIEDAVRTDIKNMIGVDIYEHNIL